MTAADRREKKLLPKLAVGAFRFQIETLRVKRVTPITIFLMVIDYLQQHVLPQQPHLEAGRYIYVFNHILRLMDPAMPAEKMGRAEIRAYIAARRREGVGNGTIRRELTLLCAARNHAVGEGHVAAVMKFKGLMPPPSQPRQRYLTREEYERLIAAPMEPRIYRFYLLDFMCGVRSRAIEELTWDRVDFANRTIDWRVPGRVYKNKRRPVQPIIDALLPHLQRWHAERRDDYVIGLGKHGKPSTTFHKCKEVMKSIGIDEPGVCRHVGRHTVVSWLLQGSNGAPPASTLHAGKYVGDTSATIERSYAHVQTHHVLPTVNTLH